MKGDKTLLANTEETTVLSVDKQTLISHIGTCEYYDLLYNQLNARAYPDHKEEDFALQILRNGICTYIELVSLKRHRVIEWMLCEERIENALNDPLKSR